MVRWVNAFRVNDKNQEKHFLRPPVKIVLKFKQSIKE